MKIYEKMYVVFKNNKRKLFLIIGIILFYFFYRGIPLFMVARPHIDSIVPNEMVAGIQFNEDNSILIRGKGLSKINALYVNGSYEDHYKIVEQTDNEVRILLPEEYYKSPQKLKIKVETRVNSELSRSSNSVKLEVIESDFILKPEIKNVEPTQLKYNDKVFQTIVLEGENFSEDSRVFAGGEQYVSVFEDGRLRLEIPFYDWCMKKSLSIQVVQSHNGYMTSKKSRMYTINTSYVNDKTKEYRYEWLRNTYGILNISNSLCNEGICDIKDIIKQNYLDGQRVFNIKFAFSEDCILHSVSDEEDMWGRLPKTYLEIQKSENNNPNGGVISCTFDDLCIFLNEYKDIYVIMDIMESDEANTIYTVYNYITEHIEKFGTNLQEQLIVKVNTKESYRLISEIYPISSIILDLEMLLPNDGIEQCAEFIRNVGIKAVIMPVDMVSLDILKMLNDNECSIYLDGVNTADMLEYVANGAYGVMVSSQLDEEFRDELLQEWLNYIELKSKKIVMIDDAKDYLEEVGKSEYICFISIKDDAVMGLSEDLFGSICRLGADLYPIENIRSSYVLVSQKGNVIAEDVSQNDKIIWKGKVGDAEIVLESAGLELGDYSSIIINGDEYSMNERGINCVVYDPNTDKVVDSINIDIYAGEILTRKTNEKFWINKKRNDENYKVVLDYLSRIGSKRYIAMIAVNDDASFSVSSELQEVLNGLGLKESLIGAYRKSYIVLLDSGKVIYEKMSDQILEYTTELHGLRIEMMSAGGNSGSYSNILINGVDYSQDKRGLNIVLYDKFMKTVLDSVCFDLYADYEISG